MYFEPTLVSYKHYHFLIMSAPDKRGMNKFIKILKKNKVHLLVRCCGLTYDEDQITAQGIMLHTAKFSDGMIPNDDIVNKWLNVVDDFFDASDSDKSLAPDRVIGVHCISGIGRSPLLVAMALAQKGMQVRIAVKVIRENKKDALNFTQECYILEKKPKKEN